MTPITGALVLLAGFSAIMSAITGVGGGVILLSGLILCVPVGAVVPIHGVVQFSAGASRIIAYRSFINWSVVRPFVLGMVPGALLGCYGLSLLQQLNPSWLLLAIASVILYTLLPTKPVPMPSASSNSADMLGLGLLGFSCGLLGMFVGSTGPLVSGSLLKRNILKEAHIASKSVMQGSAHLMKIPLFAWGLNFDFGPYVWTLLAMVGMVIVGTVIGKWCLARISTQRFAGIVRILLLLVVVKILWTELSKLIAM